MHVLTCAAFFVWRLSVAALVALVQRAALFRLAGGRAGAHISAVMMFLRAYLTILLMAALSLTGISAQAGMRDASGQMVLCTGTGPAMVYVDSDGQPTSPPADCPECLTFVADLALGGLPAGWQMAPRALQLDIATVTLSLQPLRLAAWARAPPILG
ncbi:hypothetical protein NIT7321_02667 [Phaeobacter italicus]|uniref:DUF2946 domain-containing protein n=2 Tax=Phaeobacter italicus TaxID=481446 RepID=A0A0H5D3K7_9RHOB|nr:hypothetical protein NIT7321_02667 [Phaeobacter italicus]